MQLVEINSKFVVEKNQKKMIYTKEQLELIETKKNYVYQLILDQLNENFNKENFDEEDQTNLLYKTDQTPSLQQPNFTFRRYMYQGNRLYVKLPLTWKDGIPKVKDKVLGWGLGVTTCIGWTEPNLGFNALENWKTKMRVQGIDPDAYAKEKQQYGTTMHFLFSQFLKEEVFTKKKFKEECRRLMVKHQVFANSTIDFILDKYHVHLFHALIGFSKFISDYQVEPIATELIVEDEANWVKTPIDLLCHVVQPIKVKAEVESGEFYKRGEKKGQPKMVTKTFVVPEKKVAIVDFKSGVKGFYDAHYYQLQWGKDMLKETYNIEADLVMNYSPNAEMGTDYKVKEQSGNLKLDLYLTGMKFTSNLHLMNKFDKGLKNLYDDTNLDQVLNIKGITPNDQYAHIEGDYIIDGNVKIDYKKLLNA